VNHDEAKSFIFVVSLPLLVKSVAVNLRVTDDIFYVRVPNIYNLALGIPKKVDFDNAVSYFDCKIRKLFVVVPVLQNDDDCKKSDKRI
jgi:hypothetical protein